jgi:hypothetical protein
MNNDTSHFNLHRGLWDSIYLLLLSVNALSAWLPCSHPIVTQLSIHGAETVVTANPSPLPREFYYHTESMNTPDSNLWLDLTDP